MEVEEVVGFVQPQGAGPWGDDVPQGDVGLWGEARVSVGLEGTGPLEYVGLQGVAGLLE